jgi:hypothetical protein
MDQLARSLSDNDASDDPRTWPEEQLDEPVVNTLHLGPELPVSCSISAAEVTAADRVLGPAYCGDLWCGEHVRRDGHEVRRLDCGVASVGFSASLSFSLIRDRSSGFMIGRPAGNRRLAA